ncbi:Uncharacterised protein [Bordetella pertussis]|nr:Uncharacterised protein [Bordetella pertussis]CFW11744.1 Uncharacterised protein [Bordetella pertussis]
MGPSPPICQNSHCSTSARPRRSAGMNWPVFSARYSRMAPDSNSGIGVPPSAGA